MTTKNPVVEAAKKENNAEKIHTLTSGVRVRTSFVSPSLLMEIQQTIKYPPVPIVKDEEKGQTYENPDHPAYRRDCEDVDTRRTLAAMDAVIMFGVELVDGMPEDDTWLRKLKVMDRNGALGLSDYDLEDDVDREFLYKKFVAVLTDDFATINSLVGVTEDGVTEAEDSFQSDT